MQELILKAFDKAIDKWACLALGIGLELGRDNCALCDLFYLPFSPRGYCDICPIKLFTDNTNCRDTPYENYYYHWVRAHYSNSIFPALYRQPLCEKCRIIAQQEADFLRLTKKLYVNS